MAPRSNQDWLEALRSQGPEQEAALADLRAIVLKGLPYALSKYLSPADPQFEALTEHTAQETLLRVLDRLETFEGRSKFTTWVHTIAVRIALTELRRKRWENISLDSLLEDDDHLPPLGLMTDASLGPEDITEGRDMVSKVQRIIAEELTEKQRQALIAISIKGMPIAEVARRMDSNRNAMYKLMHDARLRLKRRLANEGLTPEEVLEIFNRE